MRAWSFCIVAVCLFACEGVAPSASAQWDPNEIWSRSPGFYKEGQAWYAILHARPTVGRVRIAGEFTNWAVDAVDLKQTSDGKFWWFKGDDGSFKRPPIAGDKYKFILTGADGVEQWIQDPAARRVENSSLGANSLVTLSDAYAWQSSATPPDWRKHVIYQIHPSRFTDRNKGSDGKPLPPLLQIAEELDGDGENDYLLDCGITAVQLLPVNEFPTDHSWGYNPSFFYAVESAYGTPDDLKRLVDVAHASGIAVILDVVYNHGSSSDNVLWQAAQSSLHDGTYYDGDTQWGPLVNFDNDVARHFFVQNARFLASEYRIDGLRFDFTRPIHNPSDGNIRVAGSGGGWHFLREIRSAVKGVHPGIVMIAEELPNTWYVTREEVDGEFAGDRHGPFDSQWCDPYHDHFKAALTGSHLNNMFDALGPFGDSWQDALIYTESHDEVGNTDDRIARRARDGKGWEMSQLAAAGTLLGRGMPMVFMGQESGEWMQFGQDDGKLASYNPGTGHTWWDDRLDLDAYETDPGRTKLRDWYRKMIEVRKADPDGLSFADVAIKHVHDENGIVAFTRGDGRYLVVMNFRGNGWDSYDVGVSGKYRELANSSWPAFNFGGYAEKSRGGDAAHQLTDVKIPPYGVVVLKRED